MTSTSARPETVAPARRDVSRRTIVKGAAWAVPAVTVASAAPAMAQSGPCTPFEVPFDWTSRNYDRDDRRNATYTAAFTNPVTGLTQTLVLTLSATSSGSTVIRGDNLELSGVNIGGTTTQGITLHQSLDDTSRNMRNHYQTLTFTFSHPVYDLAFGITDIDGIQGDFYDHVELLPATGWTAVNGTNVLGTGKSGDAWRNANNNKDESNSSGNGNANIRFTQATQSFSIVYWDNRTSDSQRIDNDQKIFITNLRFKLSGCDWSR